MSESNNEDYIAAIDSRSETQTEIQSVRSTNKRKSTERVSTKKKRRGMEKRVKFYHVFIIDVKHK